MITSRGRPREGDSAMTMQAKGYCRAAAIARGPGDSSPRCEGYTGQYKPPGSNPQQFSRCERPRLYQYRFGATQSVVLAGFNRYESENFSGLRIDYETS